MFTERAIDRRGNFYDNVVSYVDVPVSGNLDAGGK